MKRKKHKLLSKWLILLLLLIIGSSIVLVANAFLRHPYLSGNRITDNLTNSANGSIPGVDSTNTTISRNGYSFSVQANRKPATAVASPSVSPNKNATGISTSPVINNGATLPPGSALSIDTTCAVHITRSSFEPRLDNNTAN